MPTVTKDGPSASFLQNEAQLKAKDPKLTKSDIEFYNINKKNYFAGTIAVCVIYGVFSLVLLLLTIFSPSGSVFITETFRTFTITFIIGMILVALLLAILVLTLKPHNLTKNPYDAQMCPDYWIFQQTPVNNPVYIRATDTNSQLMKYQCVNPETTKLKPIHGTGLDPAGNSLYTKYNADKYAHNSTINTNSSDPAKLDCSQVFPLLLNSINSSDTDINNVPNALACSYADKCGVSWSAMCPSGRPSNIKT